MKMHFIIILLLCLVSFQGCVSEEPLESMSEEDINREEFTLFCELGFLIRNREEKVEDNKECAVTEAGEFNKKDDMPVLFTLMMTCAWGATVRAIAKRFQIKTPYTVILLISGAIIGAFSHVRQMCGELYKYTAIARVSPQHILYTFLPILIFESAFSISVHTFVRSLSQILILAFPGMLLCTFATAGICWQFFTQYKWNFLISCLFGCIISATDPVAVVAILRDLGVSEQLGVIIDGESLMNDGVAILLFEIFHEFITEAEDHDHDQGYGKIVLHVFLKFAQIAIGGPIWGYVVGRGTIFMLGYVYNDAAVEISATICAAYLTYCFNVASTYIEVSGVMAVVVLGITLSAERTVISPESEQPLHHFWEMLGYLANTVLFVLVGIVISETAATHFEIVDLAYLILLYISLHVTRFLMLLMFYPILKHLGYGFEWQNMIVIMWGGLRGAVGICLALQIYNDQFLCDKITVGPKILFHTAGIVLLTLIINGTTTKGLLKVLKLTDVTVGQREEMNNAVRRIQRVKWNVIRSMQMSTTMFEARWDMVNSICNVTNPYAVKTEDVSSDSKVLKPPRPIKDNTTVCWHCSNIIENEPRIKDYCDMTNDARLRAIKSMKIHYLHMFEKGTLTETATQLLLVNAEQTEDKYLQVIHAANFHKYMKARGFYLWLRDKVIVRFKLHKEEKLPEAPDAKWRHVFYWIVCREWFEITCFTVILFNIITVIWEVILNQTSTYSDDICRWTASERNTKLAFYYANYMFTAFYTLELLIRLLGNTCKTFFCSPWTYVDILVLAISYTDLYFGSIANDKTQCTKFKDNIEKADFLNLLKTLRLIQFTRIIRLLRPLIPQLLRKIKKQLNQQVFVGYDMGKGFVETSDAVIKFIPQIAENKKVQQVLRQAMKKERNFCVKDLAVIHRKFPGIVIALKTRHACRNALNQMQFALTEIREGGLLDDPECLLLKKILEEKVKRLQHSPTYIVPTKPLTEDQGFSQQQEDERKTILERIPPV